MGSLKPKLKIETNLSLLRAERKLTQGQLAEELQVTRATVNAMEKGDYNPSLELAFRLSLFFGMSIHEIFKIKEGDYENN